MPWKLEYDGAVPNLPKVLEVTEYGEGPALEGPDLTRLLGRLPQGCWYLHLLPTYPGWVREGLRKSVYYEGTLRLEHVAETIRASGDLYLFRVEPWWREASGSISVQPKEAIPVFPRDDHRYYLRAEAIGFSPRPRGRLSLALSLHRFESRSEGWAEEARLTLELEWRRPVKAFSGWPSQVLVGKATNEAGTEVATVLLGWVSPHYRRAVVEMDKVQSAEFPLDNGFPRGDEKRRDWVDVFNEVGWDLTPEADDSRVPETNDEGIWSKKELHEAMLRWRDRHDLDTEWRYHMFCVRRASRKKLRFGVMYDHLAGDLNMMPREGVAVAFGETIPDEKPWGLVKGKRLGDEPAVYFRVAVHEIGHAMGLVHNSSGNGFMIRSSTLAKRAAGRFPENIEFSFTGRDAIRLRHLPDQWVRPGGIAWAHNYANEATPPADLAGFPTGLSLSVCTSERTLPFGAPLRVALKLHNEGKRSLPVPVGIGLASGALSGWLVDPSGRRIVFSSIVDYLEPKKLVSLSAGQSRRQSLVLIWGNAGPLMPFPGLYQAHVRLGWDAPGGRVEIEAETSFLVEPTMWDEHLELALEVLRSPLLLLPLVFRSDSSKAAVELLKRCLENRVLAPHYEMIEARRLAEGHGAVARAARLIDSRTRMTGTEILKFAESVRDATPRTQQRALVKRAISICRVRAQEVEAEGEALRLLKQL